MSENLKAYPPEGEYFLFFFYVLFLFLTAFEIFWYALPSDAQTSNCHVFRV